MGCPLTGLIQPEYRSRKSLGSRVSDVPQDWRAIDAKNRGHTDFRRHGNFSEEIQRRATHLLEKAGLDARDRLGLSAHLLILWQAWRPEYQRLLA